MSSWRFHAYHRALHRPGSATLTRSSGKPPNRVAFVGRPREPLPAHAANPLAAAAIETTNPVFVTPAEMRAWLESEEITAFTDAGDWPTPDTAALWARFRTEALSGGIQKWSIERYQRLLDVPARSAPPSGLYRIVTDEGDGRTWLSTADYSRGGAFRKPTFDPKPSLFSGRLSGGTSLVNAMRVGRGKSRWRMREKDVYEPNPTRAAAV